LLKRYVYFLQKEENIEQNLIKMLELSQEILKMSQAITFDTLAFTKKLRAAGIPEDQAEAQAEALSDVLEVNLQDLTTKGDLRETELKIEAQMMRLEGQMLLIKWMSGVSVAGILSLVIKTFFTS
jgi:hypothetical protein